MKPLHNTILYTQPEANPVPYNDQMMTDEDVDMPPAPQQIHITALELPVTYKAVRTYVPGLHARPPVLPQPNDPSLIMPPPPINGYDFILHTSVAGRGALRLEKVCHKFGYRMKDAEGQYAPTVQLPKEGPPTEEFERLERERLLLMSYDGSSDESGMQQVGERGEGHSVSDVEHQPNRGFGQGYENYPDELYTEIDVARLIHHLKETGLDVRIRHITYNLGQFTERLTLFTLLFSTLTSPHHSFSRFIRLWMQVISSATTSSTALWQSPSG